MTYFEKRNNPLLHCCATEPLRLGRAHILRQTRGGALVQEAAAGMYILAADSLPDAEELLCGVDDVSFIMLCNAEFEPLIARYGLGGRIRCRQAAYLKRELPPVDPRLHIGVAEGRTLARILEVYHISMHLQRRLGLEISPETLLMAWGREH